MWLKIWILLLKMRIISNRMLLLLYLSLLKNSMSRFTIFRLFNKRRPFSRFRRFVFIITRSWRSSFTTLILNLFVSKVVNYLSSIDSTVIKITFILKSSSYWWRKDSLRIETYLRVCNWFLRERAMLWRWFPLLRFIGCSLYLGWLYQVLLNRNWVAQ